MTLPMRVLLGTVIAAGLIACDSMELAIAVDQPEDGWLEVVNANDSVWKDARLVVIGHDTFGIGVTSHRGAREALEHRHRGGNKVGPAAVDKISRRFEVSQS